jgi:uncharacterized protein
VKAFVEWVTRAMVDHPEVVEVREVEGPQSTILEVRVSPDDLGKVIGRGGRVIKAIRTLARAAATRSGKRIMVEIVRGQEARHGIDHVAASGGDQDDRHRGV